MPRFLGPSGVLDRGAQVFSPLNPVEDPDPGASDQGFKSWSCDPAFCSATSVPTSGQLQLVKIPLRGDNTISSITVVVATAGASLTNVGFGIYSTAGALLSSSINTRGATTTAFQTVGAKQVTLAAPLAVTGAVYVGFWFTGTTTPALNKSAAGGAIANVNLAVGSYRWATANGSLTSTAPNPHTTQGQGGAPWFVGVA